MSADTRRDTDPDEHKGALEGDRPGDVQQGNENAPALDENGLPTDAVAVAEDRIGANADHSDVSNANELGQSSRARRDEEEPREDEPREERQKKSTPRE
jgi:hypothetical protein